MALRRRRSRFCSGSASPIGQADPNQRQAKVSCTLLATTVGAATVPSRDTHGAFWLVYDNDTVGRVGVIVTPVDRRGAGKPTLARDRARTAITVGDPAGSGARR